MANERDSPDDLYPFAKALVRKLVRRHGLDWNSHRVEDAELDLFLAGWQVWREKADIGLAKNRMVSAVWANATSSVDSCSPCLSIERPPYCMATTRWSTAPGRPLTCTANLNCIAAMSSVRRYVSLMFGCPSLTW